MNNVILEYMQDVVESTQLPGCLMDWQQKRKKKNLCSWNSMIVSLAVHGKSLKALELYKEMLVKQFLLLYWLLL